MTLKLSICVPSRNRQIYFQETIRALTASDRTDVEFVFTDNSDDPSVMNTFMQRYHNDPRVVFVPSGERVFSMVDNWERTVDASTGDWVTVVGDDDYLDPELAGFLERLVQLRPDVEALEWDKIHFVWPTGQDNYNLNVALTCRANLIEFSPDVIRRRAWEWVDSTINLVSGFSIYHAALSRPLLEKIKSRFGGRYFEHPTVDFDSALKVSLVANGLMLCKRPFSVMGICPLSMSGSIHSQEKMRLRVAEFMSDLGRDLDQDPALADFPFLSILGVPAAVGQVQHWIRTKYDIKSGMWEKNFAGCCQRACEAIADRSHFEATATGLHAAFKTWRGGRFAKYFNPVYVPKPKLADDIEAFSGFRDNVVYLSLKLLNPRTPHEIFQISSGLYPSVDEIDIRKRH